MVQCPVCKKHVDYKYLRTENPTDELGHDLGTWVHCDNKEGHVYLKNMASDDHCPYCEATKFLPMQAGQKVKCLHLTETNSPCGSRAFKWIEEGPPCFMNHIGKMKLES